MTHAELRAKIEALEEFHRNVGIGNIAENALIDRLDSYRAQLAALGPEPETDPPPDADSIESILASVRRDDAERAIERLHGPAKPDARDEALERLAAFAAEYGGDATGCNPQILLDEINAAIRAARGTK